MRAPITLITAKPFTFRQRVKYSKLSRHFFALFCVLVGVPLDRICMFCGRRFVEGSVVRFDDGAIVHGHAACTEDLFDVEVTDKGEA
jgi:hypothetical protein